MNQRPPNRVACLEQELKSSVAIWAKESKVTNCIGRNFNRVDQILEGKTIYSFDNLASQMVFRVAITSGDMADYFRLGGKTVARSDGTDITWLHHDHLGSPVAASDLNGAEKWREVYLPYGDTMTSPSANADDISFTGHIEDAATGLTYMQARYYDPMIGRFLSNDPMGFADMEGDPAYVNRYWYAGGDPVNATDPTGEFIIEQLVLSGCMQLGACGAGFGGDATKPGRGGAGGTVGAGVAVGNDGGDMVFGTYTQVGGSFGNDTSAGLEITVGNGSPQETFEGTAAEVEFGGVVRGQNISAGVGQTEAGTQYATVTWNGAQSGGGGTRNTVRATPMVAGEFTERGRVSGPAVAILAPHYVATEAIIGLFEQDTIEDIEE